MTTMRDSVTWWNGLKKHPLEMHKWLQDQYHGEATAAVRIRDFARQYGDTGMHKQLLEYIAKQEETHASWIKELLEARDIPAAVLNKHERYWAKTLPAIESFDTGCAVAAHAEAMRLERIRAICNDEEAPADIREVFQRILPQEEFHERAFRNMATNDAMRKTDMAHAKGLEALGLVL